MNTITSEFDSTVQELAADGLPSGVEKDDENQNTEPFDPASISIEPKVIPMDTLLRRLRQKTIRLAPTFQRKFVWDEARKSQLIESLMLRIPLPMFYVAANESGTWDVVDGLQRLTTIRDYLLGEELDEKGLRTVPEANSFKLSKLEFWGHLFDGKSYNDIVKVQDHARIINNVLETELRFTVINPGTPEEVKRNIFKRINTGGMPLTAQEIRHALYQGRSTKLLEDLVSLHVFNNAVDSSVYDSRMAGRELILRFLAFYIHEQVQYTSDMDKFLSNTMRLINFAPDIPSNELNKIFRHDNQVPQFKLPTIAELKNSFELSMKRCSIFFGKYAFRKAIEGMRRTPVNKALFESWSNIFATMSDEKFQALLQSKRYFNAKYEQLLYDNNFDRAISRDSSSNISAKYRYKELQTLINESLEESSAEGN